MKAKTLNPNLYMLFLIFVTSPFLSFGDFGGIVLMGLFCYFTGSSNLYGRNKNKIILLGSIFVLCIIQSLLYFLSGIMEFKYLSRGISTGLNAIIFILLSVRVLDMYGIKALNYTVNAYLITYGTTIIYAIILFGFQSVINSVFTIFTVGVKGGSSETDTVLEKCHSILLISPYISLFYSYLYIKTKDRKNLWYTITLIIISLMAYKRIAIGAACLVSLLFFIKPYFNKIWIWIIGIITIFLSLCYIYIIETGKIYLLSTKYEIDLMYRDKIWPLFKSFYEFDISFMGQGWGFTTKFLHENNMKLTGVAIGGLHNDILRIYIDLGFVGTIVYLGTFIIFIPLVFIKRNKKEIAFVWWLAQLYLIIIYFTDNAMIYSSCQILAIISSLCILYKRKKQKNTINENYKSLKIHKQ